MITLYGAPASRVHRVMWMLKELEITFDHVPTDFLRGGTHEEKFLRINLNGRVPVLVEDGNQSVPCPQERVFARAGRSLGGRAGDAVELLGGHGG
jgi:hypothetical protein